MSVGKRLKEFRIMKKITQEGLASLLKIATKNVSDYETGKTAPSLQSLQTIRNTYNLNLDWLLTGEGSMFISDNAENKDVTTTNDKDVKYEAIQRKNKELMQKVLDLEKDIAILDAKNKEATEELLDAYRKIAKHFERKPIESPA